MLGLFYAVLALTYIAGLTIGCQLKQTSIPIISFNRMFGCDTLQLQGKFFLISFIPFSADNIIKYKHVSLREAGC